MMWILPRSFVVGLLVLGTIVSVTVIPGVFIIDDDNYLVNVLALRQGRVVIANTAGLTPSRELVFFDPGPKWRVVTSTPVASSAPPLYAILALPFSLAGWRGLVALNTFAYLITTLLVFVYARRYAIDGRTPWVAAAAFAIGGFLLEYAQGVWPHALSVALCTGGIVAAAQAIDRTAGSRWLSAAAAGLLLGLATGVRYQNAAVLAIVAVAVFLWSESRWRATAGFLIAAAGPLAVSSAINHARLGSWNPISKGPTYLELSAPGGAAGSWFDPVVMFWARLVDFSVRPPLVGPDFSWVRYDSFTGAHLMMGQTVQKAFLQSAPWAVLAFALFVCAWLPWCRMPDPRRRQIQLLSLVTAGVLGMFAVAGAGRHEGLTFNQRYLLELVPLAAVGFAWAIDGRRLPLKPLAAGTLWGALLAMAIVFAVRFGTAGILALLKAPLLMAAALCAAWLVSRASQRRQSLLACAAGLCFGWSVAVHLTDDLAASRRLRSFNLARTQEFSRLITDGSAVLAYSGNRDALVPLLFDRDIVILDVDADGGKDAPLLVRELMARNRRVFVLQNGIPRDVLSRVFDGWQVVPVAKPPLRLVELRARPG